MRNTTKSILSVVSVGIIAASAKFGIESAAANSASLGSLSGGLTNGQTGGNGSGSTSTPSASSTPVATTGTGSGSGGTNSGGSPTPTTHPKKPTGSGTSSSGGGSNSGSGTSASGGGSTTGTGTGAGSGAGTGTGSGTGAGTGIGTGTGTGTGTVTTPAVVTKTGSAVQYYFGTMQVAVTKTGTNITAVSPVQASYTRLRGWSIQNLVDAALSSQGSNFGNMSGATYTTQAFKQALDSALAKF